jgi:hypothetical protein
MMHRILIVGETLVLSLALLSPMCASSANALPPNWVLRGEHRDAYIANVRDHTLQLSSAEQNDGFGTAMQVIASTHYVGKDVRFSGDVRSDDVARWAGLWMRVDGEAGKVLAFDNMEQRPIKGTTAWTRYNVVLPMDPSATKIAFGVLLSGKGSVWIKNLNFESAGALPISALTMPPLPTEPNLDLTP